MNVYDFDYTVYDGDSTLDFYFFCLRNDLRIIRKLPKQMAGFLLYKAKRIGKTECKESFFSFLECVKNVDDSIKKFWDIKQFGIKAWYLVKQKADDVVVSASPDFLLEEICRRMGIRFLIASVVDKRTGKFKSLNCYGEEKVKRFHKEFSNAAVEEFYSDSYSDVPMAEISDRAYIVKGDIILQWKNI